MPQLLLLLPLHLQSQSLMLLHQSRTVKKTREEKGKERFFHHHQEAPSEGNEKDEKGIVTQ